MIKILLGGSPCTYWSVARKSGREKQPSGMGWELFLNYKIAMEKFKPDFFLYENNESAVEPIKAQIAAELGVPLFHGDSSLVSAQMRRRIYAFNWQCEQPEDRGITLKDIIRTRGYWKDLHSDRYPVGMGYRNRREADGKLYRRFETSGAEKANALTTVETDSMIIEPYIHQNASLFKQKEFVMVQNGTYQHKGRIYNIALPNGDYIFRHFTQTEAERLQTLPDSYTAAASTTAARKALGNGWTADLIIHILKAGLAGVDRMEEIVVLSMYDGIGTGRYCLDKLGFVDVTYYVYEIEPTAIKIALDNYPDIMELGDAFQIRDSAWPAAPLASQPLLRPATQRGGAAGLMKDVIIEMAKYDAIKKLKKSGIVEKTMQAMLQTPDPHAIRYEELKTQLYAITTDAERLIRIAFLETTKEELLAGADYSKCETIDDMAGVYAAHLIERLGIWG